MLPTGSFYADGRGDYLSVTEPHFPSPAYTVARVARRRLESGQHLDLPDGYNLGVLETICWILGSYDHAQRVTARQAVELAQIARELMAADEGCFLTPSEKDAAQLLLKTVRPRF